jgi:hypothetical protein
MTNTIRDIPIYKLSEKLKEANLLDKKMGKT